MRRVSFRLSVPLGSLQELTPVGEEANALVQVMDAQLNNLTEVAALPASTNNSIVTSAANRCASLDTSIASLTTTADNAQSLAQNATAAVRRYSCVLSPV